MVSDNLKVRPSGNKVSPASGNNNWWLVFLFLLAIVAFNFCWFIAASLASEQNIFQLGSNKQGWSKLVLPAKKETISPAAGLSTMEVFFAPIERVKNRQMSAGCAIVMALFLILETTALIICLRRGKRTRR